MTPALAVDKERSFPTGNHSSVPLSLSSVHTTCSSSPWNAWEEKFHLCCNTFLWHSYGLKAIKQKKRERTHTHNTNSIFFFYIQNNLRSPKSASYRFRIYKLGQPITTWFTPNLQDLHHTLRTSKQETVGKLSIVLCRLSAKLAAYIYKRLYSIKWARLAISEPGESARTLCTHTHFRFAFVRCCCKSKLGCPLTKRHNFWIPCYTNEPNRKAGILLKKGTYESDKRWRCHHLQSLLPKQKKKKHQGAKWMPSAHYRSPAASYCHR